jgi:hypothetical protein
MSGLHGALLESPVRIARETAVTVTIKTATGLRDQCFSPSPAYNGSGSIMQIATMGAMRRIGDSCFVSAGAVNPSLTIIANAIRIADHLPAEHLK